MIISCKSLPFKVQLRIYLASTWDTVPVLPSISAHVTLYLVAIKFLHTSNWHKKLSFVISLYLKMLSMILSRGCLFQAGYCGNHNVAHNWGIANVMHDFRVMARACEAWSIQTPLSKHRGPFKLLSEVFRGNRSQKTKALAKCCRYLSRVDQYQQSGVKPCCTISCVLETTPWQQSPRDG